MPHPRIRVSEVAWSRVALVEDERTWIHGLTRPLSQGAKNQICCRESCTDHDGLGIRRR